jgi:hypothetical protein
MKLNNHKIALNQKQESLISSNQALLKIRDRAVELASL